MKINLMPYKSTMALMVCHISLIHNGIKFNEHVGVLQIGNTTIKILPAEKNIRIKESWKKVLIGMLQAVGMFNTQALNKLFKIKT